ncbi:MAG: hypothetical protein H0X25_17190, partial [Acidobacteriales bacterium]|nr:hypothetical protein [Terriglobales bacterium]
TYTVMYNFGSNPGDPTDPRYSGVISQGRNGALYSSADNFWTDGIGSAFNITPQGAMTVLHQFNGSDGQAPTGGLSLGTDGYYYGTSYSGGNYGFGTIFKVSAHGTFTSIYSFPGGSDGGYPIAAPIESAAGLWYGTTLGAEGSSGSVYTLSPSGTFTTLHTFTGADGTHPYAPLLQASDGKFYGTTFDGGAYNQGTIFRIDCSGKLAVLYQFDGVHGGAPYAPLIQGRDGNLYGVTTTGGTGGGGVAFRLTPTGSLTVLHNFTNGSDGGNQVGGLIEATDGNLYGTNNVGGAYFWGVLFRITPAGVFSVLHDFDYPTGASPQTSLLQHTNGLLYGDTAVGGSGSTGQGVFYSFDVELAPSVIFLPAARRAGQMVEILGQDFIGTTAVTFNGVPAQFTVKSPTALVATVPQRATSGFIQVVIPARTLTSNKAFLVRPGHGM